MGLKYDGEQYGGLVLLIRKAGWRMISQAVLSALLYTPNPCFENSISLYVGSMLGIKTFYIKTSKISFIFVPFSVWEYMYI
jgi:hypothetical protein